MLVKNMLATASRRLVVIGTDEPVRQAAALTGQPHDIIIACDRALMGEVEHEEALPRGYVMSVGYN